MGTGRQFATISVNSPPRNPGYCALFVVLTLVFIQQCATFNLETENRVVYTGPKDSFFGYSVDVFYNNSVSILIGAPKANTSQPNVNEGGSVYLCPWSQGQSNCSVVHFDNEGDRRFHVNDVDVQVEFKSHQWFGATVRSHGNTVLACAPRYYWRTEHDAPFSDVTGTCYLSVDNLKTFVEYAPCRTGSHQSGGFSCLFQDGKIVLGGPGSFYWQGQLILATTKEIVKAYYPSYFLLSVTGQIQTHQVQGSYDDSYLGEHGPLLHRLAATDINNDGMEDLVVGAPMFMQRGSDGLRWEEVGRVYVYLQRRPLLFEPRLPHLGGTQAFGRFGSSLAPLGDLNQDGFNDIAIGCPFGGDDQQGLVLIYNGHASGLMDMPTQTLAGQWASGTFPASFGYALRGNKDLDHNGYPDLIVGAFGVDKAVLYRARPIVNASASLMLQPTMINPEEKSCTVSNGNETISVSCVNLSFCLSANGKHLPADLGFVVEVQLDHLKQTQKESSVRRTLFLDSQQPSLLKTITMANGGRTCHDTRIYLRSEGEFRDKLSPIYVTLNFSLDPLASLDHHGLRPILKYQTTHLIEQKAQIQLDCGEDNICVPDLKLAVYGDRTEVYLGDDNSLTLTFNARNEGEGGAYEAELYMVLPPEADYSGIARNNQSLTQLTCSYEAENQTRSLVCDLGNPMKSGTSLWAGLRFTVPRLNDTYNTVQFELQIRSKNENSSQSDVELYDLEVAVVADVILQGVSRPDKLLFPPPNWRMSHSLQEEQDIGSEIQHVYELVNNGPSMISQSVLELRCPLRAQGHDLLYPVEIITQGPLNCSSNHTLNALKLKVGNTLARTHVHMHRCMQAHTHTRTHLLIMDSCSMVECWRLHCHVGLLERGNSVILTVRSRIWAETFIERAYKQYVLECSAQYRVKNMPYAIAPKLKPSGSTKVSPVLMWNKPESQYIVPLWIIILAILAGLLLLALLIYVLYKMGFFKRSNPYGTAMEKAQLKPQASSEA
uniref:Integrin alpha-2 domain-containing protein n=1 Tax=Oncorhynchus tshawytscha TaxID=74940 RepID=A0A8C8EIW6_ONCTS